MSEKAKLYYTGPGVFNFDEKDYSHGEVLPELPEETCKSMITKGKASTTPPASEQSMDELATLRTQLQEARAQLKDASNAADELAALRGQLQEARGEISALNGQLTASREQVTGLTAKLGTAQDTITELTNQLTAPPAAPAAGPKAGK